MAFENKWAVEEAFPGLKTCRVPDSMMVNGNYQWYFVKGIFFQIHNNGHANGNSLSMSTFFGANLPPLNFTY
jgi:hypothetical protein